MKEFDVVVVGGGSGSQVASAAADAGLEAAVIERGPLGGACITRGCVPSKALIHRADILEEIRRADSFGIEAGVEGVDYDAITDAIEETVFAKAEHQAEALRDGANTTLYQSEGRFVDDRTLAVDGEDEDVRGDRVVIAVGSQPAIPPIDGLEEVDYLTSTEALYLDERPDELAVVGGGYIGAEMGYFFAELGVDVTVIGRSDRLLPAEDRAVGDAVTAAFEERADVRTGTEASAVSAADGRVTVQIESAGDENGEEAEVTADELLVATGRKPNTDTLDLEETGVETDDRGSVEVNERLETAVENVWALGDCIGEYPFKHAADYEAEVVSANVIEDAIEAGSVGERDVDGDLQGAERTVDYTAMPHAVFTAPQVAGVGRTESELEDADVEYESATAEYAAAPMGLILQEEHGLAKVLAEPGGGEILGCHVVGDGAATMIHEVVVAMRRASGTVDDVAATIHVHPAINEVLERAFADLSTRPFDTAPDWRDVAEE